MFEHTHDYKALVQQEVERYHGDATRLVEILLELQKQLPGQYISRKVQEAVAKALELPISRVYDVVSFYSALSDTPRGQVVIQCCDSVVCKVAGHTHIRDHLKTTLGIEPGQGTENGQFWLEAVSCFGACDIAPALRINGRVYGHLNTEADLRCALGDFEAQIAGGEILPGGGAK